MDLGLTGKTVVITGGSGGIGHGLVIEFAREGANVISASRDAGQGERIAEEARQAGLPGRILAVKTDITDTESVAAMIAATRAAFGPVDVLVNNAGGLAKRGPLEDMDAASRRWELALNVDGVVNCAQAVASDMLERGKGSIINISSNAALLGEAAYHNVHYGAAKGFVNAFTRGLAWEWGPRGVRVNDIAPGWTVPHSSADVGEGSAWKQRALVRPEDMPAALETGTLRNVSQMPIKRLGRPEDIAYLTLFLASDVSGYITGQRISVSGGIYMH